jgi:hypothetical protein
VQHVEDAPRVRQEALAQCRERDAAAAPEERAAQLVLEALYPRADRRLSDTERQRGTAEAAVARDADEGGELRDVHALLHRRLRCEV